MSPVYAQGDNGQRISFFARIKNWFGNIFRRQNTQINQDQLQYSYNNGC